MSVARHLDKIGVPGSIVAAGWRRHGNPAALALGVAAGALLFVFAFVRQSTSWAYLGVAGLVTASVWNVWLARRA